MGSWHGNWRVPAGIAVAGIGVVLLVVPQALPNVLPLLLFAACPLSMVVMMLAMGKGMDVMGGRGANHQQTQPIMRRGRPATHPVVPGREWESTDLRYCTECGAAVLASHPSTRYCAQCGAELQRASPDIHEDAEVAR